LIAALIAPTTPADILAIKSASRGLDRWPGPQQGMRGFAGGHASHALGGRAVAGQVVWRR